MIEAHQLTTCYGDETVVDGTSLAVDAGSSAPARPDGPVVVASPFPLVGKQPLAQPAPAGAARGDRGGSALRRGRPARPRPRAGSARPAPASGPCAASHQRRSRTLWPWGSIVGRLGGGSPVRRTQASKSSRQSGI